jgi:hypothetical protein
MKPTILLFNFTDKPVLDKIIRAILPLKIKIKTVNKEDYLQPIGYLAGKKDIAGAQEIYNGPELDDMMLLLADMTNSQLNQLLLSLRKAGLVINLKAVLTENNEHWNTLQLYEELQKEHEAMNKTSPENKPLPYHSS